MEMHQIRYFLMVAETLNFTRAAEQCHVAQPSLTRAIKKLEEELGGDLFHREGRRTHMTDLGQMMLPLLAQSLESAQAAKEQAESYGKAEIAHLRLGLSKTIELRSLGTVLSEMLKAMPDLEFSLSRGTADEVERLLENGEVDVAVTAKDGDGWDRINQWPLFSEEFVVALHPGHGLSKRSGLRLGDLKDQVIVNRTHCEGFGGLSKLLDMENIRARFTHEVTTETDLEYLLTNNLGVGVVPSSIAFGNRDLVKLRIEDAEYRRSLFLLVVAGRQQTKPVRLFIRLLRAKDWSANKI